MSNTLSLGSFVFSGSRKGVVIERHGDSVAVCWLDSQTISENVRVWMLRVAAPAINHIVLFLALLAPSFVSREGIAYDRGVIGGAFLVLLCVIASYVAFVTQIAMRWHG